MKALGLAFVLCLAAAPALAISDPKEMLQDPAQEARAEAIGSQLRCLVCQNESIEDSGADLAHDLRAIVRKRVQAGDTDAQVTAWMVARYGNFVRLKPPLTWSTALLWFTPAIGLLAGATAFILRSRSQPPPPSPLTESERSHLAELGTAP